MTKAETSGVEIRKERDRFVAFAFSAADAFVELDHRQTVQYATGAIKSLTGMTEKTLTGQDFLNLVLMEDRPMMAAGFSLAKQQGRCGPLRLRLKQTSGKPLRIELRGTHLPISGGGMYLSLNRPVATRAG